MKIILSITTLWISLNLNLAGGGLLFLGLAVVAFFIGFLLVFFKKTQKIAGYLFLASFAGFIIGFSMCLA